MKAFKVIYKHGHFIEVETKKRIIPVQGAEYIISALDKSFKTEDALLKMEDILDSKAKAVWAEKNFGINNCEKILAAEIQLFFRIGNSKKAEGDENLQFIFVCKLLEDLYLYLLKGKKGDEEKHWRLADCKCELVNCILGGLTISEKISAESLNSLFNNTVQFYFRMQRSGSVNVFDTFFIYDEGKEINFDGAINKLYVGLSNLRKTIVSKRE